MPYRVWEGCSVSTSGRYVVQNISCSCVIAKRPSQMPAGKVMRMTRMKRTRLAIWSPSEGLAWLGTCGQKSMDMAVVEVVNCEIVEWDDKR